MKILETPYRPDNGAIDDILAELGMGEAPGEKISDSALDDILAELGMNPAKTHAFTSSAPNKKEGFPAADPLEKPVQQPSQKAEYTTPAPTKTAKAVPMEQKEAAVQVASTEKTEPEEAKPARTAKPEPSATSIWDIDVKSQQSNQPVRVGKAAALDKVESGKYSGDTELLSWFSEEEEPPLTKKEQRRLEKEQRQLEKEQRKLEKAQRKEQKNQSDDSQEEDDIWQEQDSFFGLQQEDDGLFVPQDEAVEQNEYEQNEDGQEPVSWDIPFEKDEFTASAYESRDDGWDEQAEFFDDPQPQPEHPAQPQPEQQPSAEKSTTKTEYDTQTYELDEHTPEGVRVPTAAYTQEFETKETTQESKSLFLDDMVDERFREFFQETVIVDRDTIDQASKAKQRRKNKKTRTSILTGEFTKLAEQAEEYEEQEGEEFEDYERPQDAPAIEGDISLLKTSLLRRTISTGIIGVLLLWFGFGFGDKLPLPSFINPAEKPLWFSAVYLALLLAAIIINFTTIAAGLIGLGGEATVDSPPALAGVAALLQGVVVLVHLITDNANTAASVTLFGGVAALLLASNALGKWLRTCSILDNFQLASAGFDHSAGYILDGGNEVAYHITDGLQEEDPTLLVSRPTALVKGFLRQSFSRRWADGIGRILGWVLIGIALVGGLVSFFQAKNLLHGISAFAAALCIGAPLTSSLVSGITSTLLQRNAAKVGAVVPGWSAIEELGDVNVVMAGARDVFPPSSVQLKGIKTFEKERIDLAILYAASVLIEGCDTMRDIFLGIIQGKSEILYKVESLTTEPGKGFTAWVENSRVVIGTREMLKKHDIDPPSIENEKKLTPEGYHPVYLAVSGKLFAMFLMSYDPDPEVQLTLESLVRSGVSLLVTSQDMNVNSSLIESVYGLPEGVVKVLGRSELEMMEPLTSYLPESEGVMTHIGTFTSFIGGMRAAASCYSSEKLAGMVQAASVGIAGLLCFLLLLGGGLPGLSVTIVMLFQAGWSALVSALPFIKKG